jgi:cell division protein ZapD
MFDEQKYIVYEHPLNELMRVSLRIEYLLQQIDLKQHDLSQPQTIRMLMRWFVELLTLLDRPDLKPRLTKEFNRLIKKLTANHDFDTLIPSNTLDDLKRLATSYLSQPGRVVDPFKSDTFLTSLRQALLSPAGDSPVDIPFYFNWLIQPLKFQETQIKTWLNELDEFKVTISLLLSLIRRVGKLNKILAQSGFHIQPLTSNQPLQLLRIALARTNNVYPDISAGKHRASLRLMTFDNNNQIRQIKKDISIQLIICII